MVELKVFGYYYNITLHKGFPTCSIGLTVIARLSQVTVHDWRAGVVGLYSATAFVFSRPRSHLCYRPVADPEGGQGAMPPLNLWQFFWYYVYHINLTRGTCAFLPVLAQWCRRIFTAQSLLVIKHWSCEWNLMLLQTRPSSPGRGDECGLW